MLSRFLSASRYVILIAVFGALVGAVVVLLYAAVSTVLATVSVFTQPDFSIEASKKVAVAFIRLVDLFLLGTVLYIVALGLDELFIDPDLPTPSWLHIDTIASLKEILLGVVVVLLVVSFLAEVTVWKGGIDILYYGLAIAVVIAAIVALMYVQAKTEKKSDKE